MQPRTVIACVLAAVLGGCQPSGDSSAPDAESAARESTSASGETLGYVVSAWRDEIPDVVPEDCPDGMNLTELEYFGVAALEGLPQPDACQDPHAQADPGFLTFDGPAKVIGLDLDGVDSRRTDGARCAHDDFTDPGGQRGIDNQRWRLLGCTTGFQRDGVTDRTYTSGNFIREGIPFLIVVEGVDDVRDDDEVRVRFASSSDTVSLDAAGGIVADTSMRVHENPLYTSPATGGRIQSGVLTTEPVDVRFRVEQQVINTTFYFRDLRIRADILPDGSLKGIVGAYRDADNLFTAQNDHRTRDRHTGRGAAVRLGYMCAGYYHALPRVADGHPDPETGECTSISTAIHFEAVPAFVIWE